MIQNIEEYIVSIIRHEMNLDQQHIWIQQENRKIPKGSQDLFCIVGMVMSRVISAKSTWNGETMQEEQTTYERIDVQIDLMSRSDEARRRRSEVLMALNSYYAKNVQDSAGFRIFEIPTVFANTSHTAGGSEINRFTIVVPTFIWNSQIKDFDYYDKFSAEIWTEKDKFNINIKE